MGRTFRVLVATDGSRSARAAVATAVAFPWPQTSLARAVVGLGAGSAMLRIRRTLRAAAARTLHEQADLSRRMLARRWPGAELISSRAPAAEAVLDEARRFNADAIVLGWRGHGPVRRLLAGSVSREVVARADRPVLIAPTAANDVRRVVVGFDASARARVAVRLLARLAPPRGGRVVLVSVVEPFQLLPSARRIPASIRTTLRREAAKLNRSRIRLAQRRADAAISLLKDAGWRARSDVRFGAPLESLLRAGSDHKADVLVVGARATSGLRRALLGSVASGVLNHSRVPVLVVP